MRLPAHAAAAAWARGARAHAAAAACIHEGSMRTQRLQAACARGGALLARQPGRRDRTPIRLRGAESGRRAGPRGGRRCRRPAWTEGGRN